jgi:flavin-dependent dehydrogenase
MGPSPAEETPRPLELADGSRIAVMGAGAAGSMFSFFCLDMAERLGLDIKLDLYEPRDFTRKGPTSCNMCGGIISESLVQMLATEGVNLPVNVVQRGIEGYELHTDVGSVRIETPLQEKRIATVHRGAGPRNAPDSKWQSFDGFLQSLAENGGARHIPEAITDVRWEDQGPVVMTRKGTEEQYDLLVVATGVNTAAMKFLPQVNPSYKPPQTTKTMIREFYLGEETIARQLGDAMHLYLMDIPRLEFAAIIPKGECASLCMMGHDVDKPLLASLLSQPAVATRIQNGNAGASEVCGCSPRMNISPALRPFGDRIVFIGDAGVSRLYKDGIGAAYRTAKAAAKTVIFHGVSASDFRQHYWPTCRKLATDNRFGKLVFLVTTQIQKRRFAQRAVLQMVAKEQTQAGAARRMSGILWDTFTGSAPYRDIVRRTVHPAFLLSFGFNLLRSLFVRFPRSKSATAPVAVAVEKSS